MKRWSFRLTAFVLFFSTVTLSAQGNPAAENLPKTDLRQVTTHPDIDLSPRLSPDGKALAYVSRQTYNFDIWVRSGRSGRTRQVTFNKADDFYPVWAPDSRSLVFVSQKLDAAGDIWRVYFREVDGDLIPKGEPVRISDYLGFDGYPTISPDNKKIAWVSDRSGRDEIWFYNDITKKTSQLTFNGATHPAWSSNQELIACTSFRGDSTSNGDIWLINLHGSRPSEPQDLHFVDPREPPMWRLTHGPSADGFPAWSADAQKLVFLRFEFDTNGDGLLTPADHAALWSMTPAPQPEAPASMAIPLQSLIRENFDLRLTRQAMPLTSCSENIMQPWYGSDKRIYFTSDRGGNLDIWSIPEQGPVPLLPTATAQYQWSESTFPALERATRWSLGPLYIGFQEVQPDDQERRDIWDRILSFQRVADFYPDSTHMVAQALYEMGVGYMLLGYPEQAEKYLQLNLTNNSQERKTAAYTELALLGLHAKGSAEHVNEIRALQKQVDAVLLRYADQPEPAAAGRLAIGDLYLAEGDRTRAFQEYAKVQKEYPDQHDACAASQLKIGDVFRQFASREEVVQAYLRVVDVYPDQRQWMLPARDRILELLTSDQKGSEAYIARYREIVGQYSRFPALAAEAQFRIGNILLRNGDYRAAAREFEMVETLFPDLVDEVFAARMGRAEAFLKMGDSNQAFAALDQLSQSYRQSRPDLAQLAEDRMIGALLSLADQLRASGDLELAAMRYRTAWERDLRDLHGHRGYLECMYYLKKIDAAIVEYQQLNALHPRDNILTYALGLAYSYKGTERAELYGDPDGLNPQYLVSRSGGTIARALSYDYTLVPGYLTIAFNAEMMENYEARQRAKPVPFVKRAWRTLTAPIVDLYHRFTFYEERKPVRYYERAIHELNKAIVLNDERVDPKLEASLALNLANNYYNLGEFGYVKAYEFYQIKLAYDPTFIDKPREALIYERLGHCALVTEDLEKGPGFLRHAIDLYQAMDNQNRVLLNSKRLALLYEIGGLHEQAIEAYLAAAEMEKNSTDQTNLMRSYRSIAYNYLKLDEPGDAIDYAHRALNLIDAGKVKEEKGEANRLKVGFLGLYFPVPFIDFSGMGAKSLIGFTTDDERALLFSIFGESHQLNKAYDDAIPFYQKKLALFEKRKDYVAMATFHNNIGYLYYLKGDYVNAWESFVQSLRICEKYRMIDGYILNSLSMGRVVSGLHLQQQQGKSAALALKPDLKVYIDFAGVKINSALQLIEESQIYYHLERVQLLLQLAELTVIESSRATEMTRSTPLQATMARLDKISYARIYLEEVLDASRRYRLPHIETATNYAMGEMYRSVGEAQESWKYYTRSRRLALRQGNHELWWRSDLGLGDVIAVMDAESKRQLSIQKDPLEYYLEAIEVLESYPEPVRGAMAPDLRLVQRGPYLRAIARLEQMGDRKGALEFAERMRAKNILDLAESETIVLRKERHKVYFGNARFVQKKINELNSNLLRARNQTDIDADQVKSWKQERDAYVAEYEEILDKVRQEAPELEGMVRVQAVPIRELQKRLQPQEACLFYQSLHDRTLAWIITSGAITMDSVAISETELSSRLQAYRLQDVLTGIESDQEAFWRLLVQPVKKVPSTINRLVIIPDARMIHLPWNGLLQQLEQPRRAVTVSTSLTAYYFAMQKRRLPGDKVYLAGADPLVPVLEEEAFTVFQTVAGNKENNYPDQINALSLADLIHVHGDMAWNLIDPLQSSCRFRVGPSHYAKFSARDLFENSFSAGFFALSFSQSLLSLDSAEPLYGLERGLIYSGVPTFLVPLWPGSAANDSLFFSLFYQHLRNHPPALALAQTQHDLAQQGVPFSEWGRFQMFGFAGMTKAEEEQYAVEGFEAQVRRGHGAFELGEWHDAISFYEQALQMAQRQGDALSVQRLQLRILEASVNGSLWKKAIEIQEGKLAAAQQSNNTAETANSYNNLAFFYTQDGQYEQGVHYKQKYAELAKKYGLEEEEAKSLRETGLIFENGAQYDKALHMFEQARRLYEKLPNPAGVAQCLRDMGRIQFLYLDNYAAALQVQQQAVALFRKEPAQSDLVDALHNLGLTHEKMGNYQSALSCQREALQFSRLLEDEKLTGLSHQYLANVSWKMADFQIALQEQKRALEIFNRLGDEKLLQVAYATQGLIALSLGQPEQALEYEQKALELALQRNDQVDQATIYKNLGLIYRSTARREQAYRQFEQAVHIDSLLNSQRGLSYGYRNLAALYGEEGRTDKALDLAGRGLAISRAIKDRRNEVQCYLVLGILLQQAGEPDSARAVLKRAADMAGESFMPEISWRALKELADAEKAAGNANQAIETYYAALEVIETMRARIRVEEYAAGFIDDKLDVYDRLIAVLAENGRTDEALQVAERSRSRSFLDMLGQRQIPQAAPEDARLLAAGDSLQNLLNHKQSELFFIQAQNDPLQNQRRRLLMEEIAALRQAYSEHLLHIKENNAELAALTQIVPIEAAQIQKMIPAHSALIFYHQHPDFLFAWLVTPDAIRMHKLPVSAAQLATEVHALRQILQRQLSPGDASRRLYEALFQPFADALSGIRHLIILPHGTLHYLPFALLQNSQDGYLGFTHTLSFAPSASVLGHCLRQGETFMGRSPRDMAFLAIGNPDLGDEKLDLPFAGREVASLKRYYPQVQTFSGDEATETRLRSEQPLPPLVLLSCHGVYDEANPLLSALLLSGGEGNDGRLEAFEIFALKMDAYIVAMSACETGIGKIRSGDEVVGLSRSFIYAGASSLLASLWKVDDLATAVLVKRFFRYLAEGHSRAEALRMAQQIVRDEINPYPAFWAAFQISGDFR